MSVFGVKEWWSVQCGTEEEYDVRSMCRMESGNIIVGSLQGIIRGYKPHRGDFSPDDLLFESRLDSILQLEAGLFSHSQQETIAILHPRSLEVCVIANSTIRQVYEHKLQRNAFNFTYGKFGTYNREGRDFICIQSSDGALGFYEQENYIFAVQLPGFLTPGPLLYCPSNDSFLLCNANMQLECYRYARLRDAYTSYQQGQSATFEAEWKIVLGEYAQEIRATKRQGNVDVYVLGEHTLFGIKINGSLKVQKKLDYVPSCMWAFEEDSVLIGSFSGHLLVYKNTKLLWAAKMTTIPVAIRVIELEMPGLILSLEEHGKLDVSYLGTSPMPYSVVPVNKTQDYASMDREYRNIVNTLSDSPNKSEPSVKLIILPQVPKTPERDMHTFEGFASDDEGTIVTNVKIGLKYDGDLVRNVCVQIEVPYNIECPDNPIHIEELRGTASVPIRFLTKPHIPCSHLNVNLNATYFVNESPRVSTASFRLPLLQVSTLIKPIKTADFKITLKARQTLNQLKEIFYDVSLLSPNAITYQLFNGEHVTAITGKTGERFRIQSSHFHTLWLMVEEICLRVGHEKLAFEEPLPFQDLFQNIDSHFEARKLLKEEEDNLGKLCEQYAAIQKRLLVRFKDKNPAPLNNLDYLLHVTHAQVMARAENVEALQEQLLIASQKLSASINLALMLLRMRFNLDNPSFEVLSKHLNPFVMNGEPGWQEVTNVAMTWLLKSVLAKNEKEANAQLGNLNFPTSTEKLKKHITIVCDRLAKGGRLIRE